MPRRASSIVSAEIRRRATRPRCCVRWGRSNTKRGDPVLVEPLWGSGLEVDITDVEGLADLLPAEGIFTRRPTTNGAGGEHATSDRGPVDVDTVLAEMKFEGEGDSSIHSSQLRATASLLRSGVAVDEVVDQVLVATRHTMAGDPRAAAWTLG